MSNKWKNWYKFNDEFEKFKNIKSNLICGNRIENVKFSIVIPMYKRYDYLEEALKSALHQDIDETFEVVIFDNDINPNDKKMRLIQSYVDEYNFLSYYRHEQNLGMFGNFNRSISMANGEWVVVLHDDDMLKKNYLSTMKKIVSSEIAMIAAHPEILDMRDIDKVKKNSKISRILQLFNGLKPIYLDDFFNIAGVSPICALLNKGKFIDSGGYDETLFPSSDIGGVMKLGTSFPIYYYPEKLFYYRYDVNESMNEKTSRDFIDDTFDITYELGKYLNYSEKKINKVCAQNVSSCISYSLLSNRNELFEEYFLKYNIPSKYRVFIYVKYLQLKNGLFVFKRLLRKRK